MDYTLLLHSLETLLGKSQKKTRDNYAFHCPFCNHRKPKLEIDLFTNEKGENVWHCWVCSTRGKTIKSLLRQLKTPVDLAKEILLFVGKGEEVNYTKEDLNTLPEEFQPLYFASKESVIANKVRKYLYNRGLRDIDFLKYNIGYCTKGDYEGRVIFPSYDENGKLNYFVARSYEGNFYKYKNPSSSKDVIVYENFINWDLPIVLVEGMLDAIAVRRNAIPILGKNLSKSLMKRLVSPQVKDVYIGLDKDAMKESLSISEKLLSIGKVVYLIEMQDKDPSEIGFENFHTLVRNTPPLDMGLLMKYKLNL